MWLPLSFICHFSRSLTNNKSVSVIIIVAAIAGPLWISTEEKIPWMAANSSMLYRNSNYTVSYIVKSSNASLWILCTRQGLFIGCDKSFKNHFRHFFITSKSEITFFFVNKIQRNSFWTENSRKGKKMKFPFFRMKLNVRKSNWHHLNGLRPLFVRSFGVLYSHDVKAEISSEKLCLKFR